MTVRILIVDDEEVMRVLLVKQLSAWGYEVDAASGAPEALARFDAQPYDVVLTDLKMPSMDGVELTRELRRRDPDVVVLLMSAHGTIEDAVAAVKEGAADFITKPLSMDGLQVKLQKSLRARDLERENTQLHAAVDARAHFGELIGSSIPMRRVYSLIERAAPTEVTVLIDGQTGTGKELVARAVHLNSPRRGGPFMPVNCAALTETLLESELFGHERGSFTGAHERKIGVIERARGGTLFLDEIASSSPGCQSRLLRAIQEREILRVGSTQPVRVDFRLVCATNANLKAEVRAGRFREDLFYRISPLIIELPPLRERLDDMPGLVQHLMERLAVRSGRAAPPGTERAILKLSRHAWPGNVRELENVLERAMVVDTDGRIDDGDIPTFSPATGASKPDERAQLVRWLSEADGNMLAAARLSGVGRGILYRKLKKFNLNPADFRKR